MIVNIIYPKLRNLFKSAIIISESVYDVDMTNYMTNICITTSKQDDWTNEVS